MLFCFEQESIEHVIAQHKKTLYENNPINMYRFVIGSQAEKGRDPTQSFDKRPLPSENKSQEAAQRR